MSVSFIAFYSTRRETSRKSLFVFYYVVFSKHKQIYSHQSVAMQLYTVNRKGKVN